MSRKDTLLFELLNGQSLSTSFVSAPTVIRFTDNVSYQINVTTSNSTGSFAVQVSDDYAVGPGNVVSNPGTWNTLVLSGSPTVAGANDIISISLNQLPFFAIRLAYTSTIAGTGTATAYISSKMIGG